MTPKYIKEILLFMKRVEDYNQDFASVWALMDENARQLAETKKLIAESNERADKSTKESNERMDRMFEESNERLDRMFEESKKLVDATTANIDKYLAEIKETRKEVGGIGNTYGKHAESYFFESLKKSKQFGGITYKHVVNNVKGTYTMQNETMIVDEFDIVMHNGDSIVIIEVKSKVEEEHVIDLINRKIGNYKLMSPQYAHKKFYLGVAGFFIKKDAEKEALKCGVGILTLSGDNLEIQDNHLRIY